MDSFKLDDLYIDQIAEELDINDVVEEYFNPNIKKKKKNQAKNNIKKAKREQDWY